MSRLGQIWAAQHTLSGLGERASARARCAHDGDEGLVTNLSLASRTAQPGRQPETTQNGPLMNTRQSLVVYWLPSTSSRRRYWTGFLLFFCCTDTHGPSRTLQTLLPVSVAACQLVLRL